MDASILAFVFFFGGHTNRTFAVTTGPGFNPCALHYQVLARHDLKPLSFLFFFGFELPSFTYFSSHNLTMRRMISTGKCWRDLPLTVQVSHVREELSISYEIQSAYGFA